MFYALAAGLSLPIRLSFSAPGSANRRRACRLYFCLSLAVLSGLLVSGCGHSSAAGQNQAASKPPHSVTLTWKASVSNVVGYKIYRSLKSGGPYTLIQATPVAGTSFVDSTVYAGQTYFYVVTSVDKAGSESAYSKEISVTVPTP